MRARWAGYVVRNEPSRRRTSKAQILGAVNNAVIEVNIINALSTIGPLRPRGIRRSRGGVAGVEGVEVRRRRGGPSRDPARRWKRMSVRGIFFRDRSLHGMEGTMGEKPGIKHKRSAVGWVLMFYHP
jgi:hypothetical protein